VLLCGGKALRYRLPAGVPKVNPNMSRPVPRTESVARKRMGFIGAQAHALPIKSSVFWNVPKYDPISDAHQGVPEFHTFGQSLPTPFNVLF
jgi:hypothetical protein